MKDWTWVLIALVVFLALKNRQQPLSHNEEVWEYEDYRGNKRKVTVHREAHGF